MKNGILAIIGLCVWGGLLMLQGTPKVSEEIAADVVQTLHPQAEVENVTDTCLGCHEYLQRTLNTVGEIVDSLDIVCIDHRNSETILDFRKRHCHKALCDISRQ